MTMLLFGIVVAVFCLVGKDAGFSSDVRGMGLTGTVMEAVERYGGFFADDIAGGRYKRLATGAFSFPTWFEFILASVFIFWSMSRRVEKMCGPLSTGIAFVLGGAAGNAAVAIAMPEGHIYIPPFGAVMFGLDGLLLGCLLRYRSVFPRSAFMSVLMNTLFWIALITVLMFFAFGGSWQYLLDIPAGLLAGFICGLLFPVPKYEQGEAPMGGTIIKYLCFAAVVAVLAAGFLALDVTGGEGVSPGVPGFSSDEHVNGDAGFALRLPEGADVQTKKTDEKNITSIIIKSAKVVINIVVTPSDEPPEWVVSIAQEKRKRRIWELENNENFAYVVFVGAMQQVLGGVKGYEYWLEYKELIPPAAGKTKTIFINWFEFDYLFIHRGKEYKIMVSYPEDPRTDSSLQEDVRLKILESFRFLP